jgi:hypothetical protein
MSAVSAKQGDPIVIASTYIHANQHSIWSPCFLESADIYAGLSETTGKDVGAL